MAEITKITHDVLQTSRPHTQVECSYDIVTDAAGNKSLQLDTFGSKNRELKGKKSQSIRLSPSALADLKKIMQKHGL